MATVTGMTAAAMQAIADGTVVSATVNPAGDLILTKHDGTTANAGHVKGSDGSDGSDAPAHKVSNYNRAVNYVQNDIVNFAGRLYKSKRANVGKRPPFYSADWEPVSPAPNGWVQTDPFFLGQGWDHWETFWSNGGVVRAYTSVAGEFVTGHRALKLTIPAGGSQRLFPKELNLVGVGERVVTVAKARLLTALSTNVYIVGTLHQAEEDGHPEPYGSGAVDVNAEEGLQLISSNWTDFTFSNTAAYARPQARANIVVFNNGPEAAEVLIDQIYTHDPATISLISDSREPIQIPSGTNLNNILTPGDYWVSSDPASGLNYPVLRSGTLEVRQNSELNSVTQRFTPRGVYHNEFYVRTKSASLWYLWKSYTSDGGWLDWSPLLLSTGTNPTMGNTVINGRYRVQGKTVQMTAQFVIGSTFSPGTGAYMITLPVMPATTEIGFLQVVFLQSGERPGYARIEGTSGNLRIQVQGESNAYTTMGASTNNITPVSGNRLIFSGTYEAS